MTSELLAVIVGGAIGILAAMASSVVSLCSTRMQLRHQKEAQRQTYLVEARRVYLLPLRETIAQWMEVANSTVAALGRIQAAKRYENTDPAKFRGEVDNLNRRLDDSQQMSSKFDQLRDQTGDECLETLIGAFKRIEEQSQLERLRLTRMFNESIARLEDVEAGVKRYEEIIADERKSVRAINRRIESLLAGDRNKTTS